jgi:LruC domain-containing protein
MKATNRKSVMSLILLIICISCEKYENSEEVIEKKTEAVIEYALDIPEGFNFSTHNKINVNIKDSKSNIKYDVFQYSEELIYSGEDTSENLLGEMITESVYKNDIMDKLIFSGTPTNGELQLSVNIPTFCDKLYVRRKDNLEYKAFIVDLVDNKLNFNYSEMNTSKKNNKTDYLYAINVSGELFKIDPLDGSYTLLQNMPDNQASAAAAIDNNNNVLYSVGKNGSNPLLKYDIATDTWTTIGNVNLNGPRLDFYNGIIYFSTDDKIYTIDSTTGALSSPTNITGLDSLVGGDLVFDNNGVLYMCTYSGLYVLTLNNGVYQATRISSDNLPFTPTSMSIDSNGELWLADIGNGNSSLIIMDTTTGGWEYKYGIDANNGTDYGRKINDLTTHIIVDNNYQGSDCDGDTIDDNDDAYPCDPSKAFEIYTPSKYGQGTIAFEDLWPSEGDYDFNDMALSYQTLVITNSQNNAVQIDIICNVKSKSAGFINGVGIQIDGITPSDVQSVTGTVYTENIITNNSNGTEAGQSKAVIILTDNTNNLITEKVISIVLTNPISTATLGESPFNPFLIRNKVRANEVHLPYYETTSLGNNIPSEVGTKDDDGNYISETGYPWAISIIHDFKVPKEGITVTDGYNYFGTWAESGGTTNLDWYKDSSGYRNDNKLED